MIRANLKGHSGFKGLLLKHGEKIGLAITGIVVAGFISSSLNKDKLESDEPEKLRVLVSKASQHIDTQSWDQLERADKKVAATAQISGKRMRTVKREDYPKLAPYNEPVITQHEKRRDPVLLAVVDLEARGGADMIPHLDEDVARARELARIEEQEQERAQREREAENEEQDRGRRGGGRGGPGGEGAFGDGGRRGGGPRGRGGGGPPRGLGGGPGRGSGVNGDDPNRRMIETAVRPPGFIPQGDERVDLIYWTCLTGKVPLKKQRKEYRDALRKSFGYDPTADDPRYFGYKVERAEVDEDGSVGEWTKRKIRGKKFDDETRRVKKERPTSWIWAESISAATFDWPEQMPPVVSPEYLHSALTFPLPPVIGRFWADDATHSDVPLFDPKEQISDQPVDTDDEADDADEEPTDEDDVLAGDLGQDGMADGGGRFGRGGPGSRGVGGRGGPGLRGGGPGLRGGGPGLRGGGPGLRGGPGIGSFGEEGGYGGRGYGRGGDEDGGYRGRGGPGGYGGAFGGRGYGDGGSYARGGAMGTDTEFFLLRFFDFDVAPGKKYKYRVQLYLFDPNNGMPRQYLASEAVVRRTALKTSTARKVRPTDWSEPSATVGIPLPGQVLAGVVKPAAKTVHNSEPSAKLTVKSFRAQLGSVYAKDSSYAREAIEAVVQADFLRGMVCNLVKSSDSWVISADRRELYKAKKGLPLNANIMLVDMAGGEKLAGASAMAAPCKVLLMDLSGRLYVRSEVEDAEEVELYQELLADDRDRRDRGRGGEGGFGRGGGYGGLDGGRGRGGGRR